MARWTYVFAFALGCGSSSWGKTLVPCPALDARGECVPVCDDIESCPSGTLCRTIADGAQHTAICCSGAGCPAFVPFSNPCDGTAPSCVAATIHVSASTNSAPIDVVVHANGSAERTIEPGSQNIPTTPRTFLAGDPDVERFLSDLVASGDVELYAVVPHCAKSISFGTTTRVTSGAETSDDVECMSPDAPLEQRALADDCGVLAHD
jgi:hypothetical protein